MSAQIVEWDCAVRPFPGEEVSGDQAVVASVDGGAVAAAIDGLGHGEAAALAAERATHAIRTAGGADVTALVKRCHDVLRDTRGAAMTIASIDHSRAALTWLGVGNVTGRILRGRGTTRARAEELLLMPGVVGHELPPLRTATVALERGDLVLMATDGVDPGYADDLEPAGSCGAISRAVLERHARDSDDALVVVIRYLGGEG